MFKLDRNKIQKIKAQMKLVAGLGNPGESYKYNRHNTGFLFIDSLVKHLNVTPFKKRRRFYFSNGNYYGNKIILIKPLLFMNLSGIALLNAASYHKIDPTEIIVVHDDTSLPFGKLRIKNRGTDGGHKGICSIIESLRSNDFIRVKIGIGSPLNDISMEDYVLENFTENEMMTIKETFEKAVKAVKLILRNNLSKAMNEYN